MKIDVSYRVNTPYLQNLERKIQRAADRAIEQTDRELIDQIEEELKTMYRNIIEEWYAGYSPEFYQRSYSLYDLLEFQRDGGNLSWEFVPENITPFERGGGAEGAYEHAFRYGWHGGATGTDKRGEHRSVPSYRKPYIRSGPLAEGEQVVTRDGSKYIKSGRKKKTGYFGAPFVRWGRTAAQSEPPLAVWRNELAKYDDAIYTKRFNDLFQQHFQEQIASLHL